MNDIPHIIEAALLLLIAFLFGCIIGWFLRAKIFKKRQKPVPSESVETIVKSEAKSLDQASGTVAKAAIIAPKAVPDVKASLRSAPQATSEPEAAGASPKLNVVASKPRKAAIAEVDADKPEAGKPDASKLDASKLDASKLDAEKPNSGKPDAMSAPRAGGKDDLKKIKGVGPKLENTLNGLGIYHFDQIASWKRAEIDWVDDYLSFKGRIDRDDWINQAKKFSA